MTRTAARVFFAIESGLDVGRKLGKYGYALYQGVLFGLLDRDALYGITALCYDGKRDRWSGRTYNNNGLHPWEELVVDKYFAGRQSVLVGCAGGGREIIGLLRRGFTVDAFECSPHLVAVARALLTENGLDARLVESAPDEVPDLGMHDAAIVGWCGYMHILGRRARIAFLRGLRAHVVTGGPLLVSFLGRWPDNREHAWIASVANALRRVRKAGEPVEVGDEIRDAHSRHRFVAEEIRAELSEAGFRVEFYAPSNDHAIAIAV